MFIWRYPVSKHKVQVSENNNISIIYFLDLYRLLTERVPVAEGTLVLVQAGLAEAAVVAGEGAMS